ncbi:MAG: 4Fe-4S dicluster domain-containing protein [Promethearchaeota archaeon]|nr:MAG: 4Fe-4S dicluster domain-containing protein [Candidatus Lokiarchaeota archaeon]
MDTSEYYKELAEKLDETIFGLSRNEKGEISDTWIEYLKLLVPEEHVKYIIKLDVYPFLMSAKAFARKINRPEKEATEILEELFNRDCVMRVHTKKRFKYAIHLPFLLFDAPVLNFNHGYSEEKAKKVAELSLKFLEDENWYKNFEGTSETPLSRIVPIEESIPVKSEILSYEDATSIIDNAEVLSLHECACRARLEMVGKRKCKGKFPLKTCIGVNDGGQYVIDREKGEEISKEKAKELLKEFSKMGLVHTTENFKQGNHMILCSCCPCCCNLLGGITKPNWDNPRAIAASNYIAVIDKPDECQKCELCIEKCPFNAIFMNEADKIEIDRKKCMGCGVCTMNCPVEAIKLERLERETIFNDQITLGLKISQEKNVKIKF